MDHSPANRALAYPSPAAFHAGVPRDALVVVAEGGGLDGKPEDDALAVGLERGGDDLARLGAGLLRLRDEPALLDEALDHAELCGR